MESRGKPPGFSFGKGVWSVAAFPPNTASKGGPRPTEEEDSQTWGDFMQECEEEIKDMRAEGEWWRKQYENLLLQMVPPSGLKR